MGNSNTTDTCLVSPETLLRDYLEKHSICLNENDEQYLYFLGRSFRTSVDASDSDLLRELPGNLNIVESYPDYLPVLTPRKEDLVAFGDHFWIVDSAVESLGDKPLIKIYKLKEETRMGYYRSDYSQYQMVYPGNVVYLTRNKQKLYNSCALCILLGFVRVFNIPTDISLAEKFFKTKRRDFDDFEKTLTIFMEEMKTGFSING